MSHHHRFTAAVAALRTTPRRSIAVLAVAILTLAAGGATAGADVGRPSTHWTQTTIDSQDAVLNDVDARSGAIWAVGNDLRNSYKDPRPLALRRVDGRWVTTPQPVRFSATLEQVAVAGPNDVWAVGNDDSDPSRSKPLVMHWSGQAWRVVPGPSVPTGSFGDVTIAPDGAVWAAGWAEVGGIERAVVYRYAGGTWHPLNDGLEDATRTNTLAVVSADDAWAGLNAGLAHFDGDSWTLVDDLPTDGSRIPTAMAAAGPRDIWLVGVDHIGGPEGERPLALHYDGSSWTSVPMPRGSAQLYDVALRNGRPVTVGESLDATGAGKPLVLEYRGSGFSRAGTPTTAQGVLTGADVAAGRLWTVGFLYSPETDSNSPFAAVARWPFSR